MVCPGGGSQQDCVLVFLGGVLSTCLAQFLHKPAQRYRERGDQEGKCKLLREGGAARRVLNVDMAKQNSNSLDNIIQS